MWSSVWDVFEVVAGMCALGSVLSLSFLSGVVMMRRLLEAEMIKIVQADRQLVPVKSAAQSVSAKNAEPEAAFDDFKL
jgi:hypothetical protein